MKRNFMYGSIQMATCNENVGGLFRNVWRMHRAQFLGWLPCVPRSKASLGEGDQKSPGFRPRVSHPMRKSLIIDTLPQVRNATSVKRIRWGLIRGTVSPVPSVQKC